MSVQSNEYPRPFDIKEEEDQKIFIDLDAKGNSPEDIVIEWHLEIKKLFSSDIGRVGENRVIDVMKEYIISITERAVHFEEIAKLQEMVDKHMELIYCIYQDSVICFADMYLDYMEHILTFYVNLTLRELVNRRKVKKRILREISQTIIRRLSFYLLQSEYHIFHVLIRQTSTQNDGMVKDVLNNLNWKCNEVLKHLYRYFLTYTDVRDVSDEAFCRCYILFENWKALEPSQQTEIEECFYWTFKRGPECILDNDFLRNILIPKPSIVTDLMRTVGCDSSITKAYFDHIKFKQKMDVEILGDQGNFDLEEKNFSDSEMDDEDEVKFRDLFNILMNTKDSPPMPCLENVVKDKTPIPENIVIEISDSDDSESEIDETIPNHRQKQPTSEENSSSASSVNDINSQIGKECAKQQDVIHSTSPEKDGFKDVPPHTLSSSLLESPVITEVNDSPTTQKQVLSLSNPSIVNEDSLLDRKITKSIESADPPSTTTKQNDETSESNTPEVIAGSSLDMDCSEVIEPDGTNSEHVENSTQSENLSEENASAGKILPEVESSNSFETLQSEVDSTNSELSSGTTCELDNQKENNEEVSSPENSNRDCSIMDVIIDEIDPEVRVGSVQESDFEKLIDEKSKTHEELETMIISETASNNLHNEVGSRETSTPRIKLTENTNMDEFRVNGSPKSPSVTKEPIYEKSKNDEEPESMMIPETTSNDLPNKVGCSETSTPQIELTENRNMDEFRVNGSPKTSSVTMEASINIPELVDRPMSDDDHNDNLIRETSSSHIATMENRTENEIRCEQCSKENNNDKENSDFPPNGSSIRQRYGKNRQQSTTNAKRNGQTRKVGALDTGQLVVIKKSEITLDTGQTVNDDDDGKTTATKTAFMEKNSQPQIVDPTASELGFLTPPGSEEEAEKDGDEHHDGPKYIHTYVPTADKTEINRGNEYAKLAVRHPVREDEEEEEEEYPLEVPPTRDPAQSDERPPDIEYTEHEYPEQDIIEYPEEEIIEYSEQEIVVPEHVTGDSSITMDDCEIEEYTEHHVTGDSSITMDDCELEEHTEDHVTGDSSIMTDTRRGADKDADYSEFEEEYPDELDDDDDEDDDVDWGCTGGDAVTEYSGMDGTEYSGRVDVPNDDDVVNTDLGRCYERIVRETVEEETSKRPPQDTCDEMEQFLKNYGDVPASPEDVQRSKKSDSKENQTDEGIAEEFLVPQTPNRFRKTKRRKNNKEDHHPPLRGILKKNEHEHSYLPLHPLDEENDNVNDYAYIGYTEIDKKTKTTSSKVCKVLRECFVAYNVPENDLMVRGGAVVQMEQLSESVQSIWEKITNRTRSGMNEETSFPEPDQRIRMTKIVYDKKTNEINSNDKIYYFEPSARHHPDRTASFVVTLSSNSEHINNSARNNLEVANYSPKNKSSYSRTKLVYSPLLQEESTSKKGAKRKNSFNANRPEETKKRRDFSIEEKIADDRPHEFEKTSGLDYAEKYERQNLISKIAICHNIENKPVILNKHRKHVRFRSHPKYLKDFYI